MTAASFESLDSDFLGLYISGKSACQSGERRFLSRLWKSCEKDKNYDRKNFLTEKISSPKIRFERWKKQIFFGRSFPEGDGESG